MRDRLRRARAHLRRFLDQSAWAPLVGRAAGIAGGLLLLAAVGMGWFDRTLDLGPPRAEAAADRAPRPERRRPSARPPVSSEVPGPVASAAAGAPPAPVAKVVLNTASASELERLPGVGPAKAQAIVALRTKLGGKLKRFEDLLRVRGIKRRSLERIREHAVLDAPPPEAPPAGASASPQAGPAGRPPSPAPPATPPW